MQRTNALKYIGSSLTGSGLATLAPCAIALANAPYRRINVGMESIYKFVVSFIETGLRLILTASVIMIIVGIIAVVLNEYVVSAMPYRLAKHKR